MLHLLQIENIALIEEAEIPLHTGFNVLTGETGAGKSIVVDSISAVLGERVSRDLIRTGSKSATVTGHFSGIDLDKELKELGIEPAAQLILQREIRSDGKNFCRANGKSVTVAQLKELGRSLLSIHGQHDGQHLLDPLTHLGYLDSFGKTQSPQKAYEASYEKLKSITQKMKRLAMDEGEKARKIDSLQFQIEELERAELSAEEDSALEAKQEFLRNTGKLMEGLHKAKLALFGDEDSTGAFALLEVAQGSLERFEDLSPQLGEICKELMEISSLGENCAENLRDVSRDVDISPEELDAMESRLDFLYRLKKKYGDTVAEMLNYLAQCQEELSEIVSAEEKLDSLQEDFAKQLQQTKKLATALTTARIKAGESLTARVVEELHQLDMPKVEFSVEFTAKTSEHGLDETGADVVQFLMSANVGEVMKPISKVASGGELSRIMLAMKNVLATDDKIHSLVFDEVDTGVSGRAAQKVAEKMADVSGHKQVLCISHLPQIAAMADAHLFVEKGEQEGRTYTKVTILDREGRREELARLIGGNNLSQAILSSAEELLVQAEEYKT